MRRAIKIGRRAIKTGLPALKAPLEWATIAGGAFYTAQAPIRPDRFI
ncbi:MAG: hypothetical protein ACKVSF_13250 [Alphaproteobacteria bacterium]